MSQQKAQLISPIDTFTPPGINVTGAGIVTATSFVGSGGTVTGLAAGANVLAGIFTATSFYGDGSNLNGIAAAGYVGQTTAAQSGTTTIDLSAGNVIYFTQDTDTTVAFASTEAVQELLFIRTKDDTPTARTITWPDSIIWNGGTAPTLIDSSQAGEVQIFNLTTRDQGVTWYGYEAMKNDPVAISSLMYLTGYNNSGELGLNDTVRRSSPTQIPGTWQVSNYKKQSGVSGANTLIKNDGTLWAWGYNGAGGLGQNDRVDRSSPIQIPGTSWSTVNASSGSTVATKTDGTLWVWGYNTGARSLGLNNTVYRSSPTQIPGTQWNNAKVADNNGIYSKTDGTLWGVGAGKGVASNNNVTYSSPRQIPGTWNTDNFDLHFNGFLGLKTDNTLWHCGYNSNGIAGQNTSISYYSSPVQIPGTQWSSISDVGRQAVAAFKTDGSLWVWGYNDYGNLGQNSITNGGFSSPVQLPGTSWSAVSLSNDAGMYLKTDGTLYSCGRADNGQGGLNDTVRRSSPTQIPGTWSGVAPSSETNASFMLFQE